MSASVVLFHFGMVCAGEHEDGLGQLPYKHFAQPSATFTVSELPQELCFSADGRAICVRGRQALYVFDSESTNVLSEIECPKPIIASSWSDNRGVLVTLDDPNLKAHPETHEVTATEVPTIRVWDVESGRETSSVDVHIPFDKAGHIGLHDMDSGIGNVHILWSFLERPFTSTDYVRLRVQTVSVSTGEVTPKPQWELLIDGVPNQASVIRSWDGGVLAVYDDYQLSVVDGMTSKVLWSRSYNPGHHRLKAVEMVRNDKSRERMLLSVVEDIEEETEYVVHDSLRSGGCFGCRLWSNAALPSRELSHRCWISPRFPQILVEYAGEVTREYDIVNVLTGNASKLLEASVTSEQTASPGAFAWSDDGRLLAIACPGHRQVTVFESVP